MDKKLYYIFFALLAMFVCQVARADVITEWTIEAPTTPADLPNSAVGPTVQAFTGSGTLQGVHASSSSDWTTPAGNGSTDSYSVNTWAIGDYFEFTTSSTGYQGIEVCFDQAGSGTGPRDFTFSYSTAGPGGPYTDHASYQVLVNGTPNTPWSAGGAQLPEFRTCYDLSTIPALDNQASIAFRLAQATDVSTNGGAVLSGGTSRVDNITVSGTLIPEPSSAILALFGLAILALPRQRS